MDVPLWAVWKEQLAQLTLHFGPRTIQEGNECITTKEKLRAYCPNRYTVTASKCCEFSAEEEVFFTAKLWAMLEIFIKLG